MTRGTRRTLDVADYSRQVEGRFTSPFSFVQLADCQFGMLKQDQSWAEEQATLRLATAHINSMRPRPRFVVICGDLINAYPTKENKAVRVRQTKDLRETLSYIDEEIPLVCVCGNHDIGNRPTSDTIDEFRGEWGADYFDFWVSGVLFLVLNTQLYVDASGARQEAERQDRWLQQQLAEQAPHATNTVLLSHVPPFVERADEEDGWANIPTAARVPLLARARDAGVSTWLCGHYHQNAGGWFGEMEVVVTSAVGAVLDSGGRNTNGPDSPNFDLVSQVVADPAHSGLRVVRVRADGSIAHAFHTLDAVPAPLSSM